MKAEFNTDKLLERLLSDIIELRVKNFLLESSVDLLMKDRFPNFDDVAFETKMKPKIYQEILSSYPEIDEAFLKKLRDELGI